MTNQIDQVISSFVDETSAADDLERRALRSARNVLRGAIAAERPSRRGRLRSRRSRAIVLFAALAIVGIAVPAFGVAGKGWFRLGGEVAGVRGSADPKLTAPPVVVASGEPGQPWSIVAARSNQGLCLNVDVGDEQFSSDKHRLGQCSYSDIRGELPPDVRGDPSATCIGLTRLVRCGSLPKYWLQLQGAGIFVEEARRSILVGAAAVDVSSVEIALENGETLDAEVVERPLGPDVPLNVYWAELGAEHGLRFIRGANGRLMPCVDNVVEMAVARDSEGRVLGRRVPAWNGNPTGDPDGQQPPRTTEDECA
jgi:hypothetical protein